MTDRIMGHIRARRGCWGFKTHGGAEQGAGLPDVICCYRGRFIAVECKRPGGGRLSQIQSHELKKISRAGGVALVARGEEAFVEALDRIDGEGAHAPADTV